MTKKRNNHKLFRLIFSLILIILQMVGIVLVGYTLLLFEGVETLYRILGIAVLVYFFLFFSYLLLRSVKKQSKISFIIPVILVVVLFLIEGAVFYYVTKVYKAIDNYSDSKNTYYSSIVSYDKTLKSEKDLINKKIGIVNDKDDIYMTLLLNYYMHLKMVI